MVELDTRFGAAPLLRTPHPGPRGREILARVGASEATAALTFGLSNHPLVLSRARGAVIEPDGHTLFGHGGRLRFAQSGHSHPPVVEAAARQLSLGQQAISIAA